MPMVPTSPSMLIHSCSSVYFTSAISRLLSAVVSVFDERHGNDLGRHRLAAHHQLDLGAVGGVRLVDVAHGDGALEARREAARSDFSDHLATDDDLRTFARDRLAFGKKADPLARRTFGDLFLHNGRAREAALHAALLADTPQQHGLDRSRGGVDVMAVQAEACLETQRVTGAEADRFHFRLSQQLSRDGLGSICRSGDLVAVAAGVAGA